MSKITVTGSKGFIGRALTEMLEGAGNQVIPWTRAQLVLGDRHICDSSLETAMRDSQAIIHLAGRAHVTHERRDDPLGEYRRVNVEGTLALAEMAARAGVPRFVFVSSIGVLGNTSGDAAFSEADAPAPVEPYAISKWEAEQALRGLAADCVMQIVIVRPPLAYGRMVKGNFLRLLRLINSGMPLPFGAFDNRRSYIGVHNLCGFLHACATHPSAAGRTFHVADGEDVSTPDLLRLMSAAMGKKARLYRCPPALLYAAANVLGKRAELARLAANLRVDSSAARAALGWRPTKPLDEGIAEMVRWFALERGP